MTFSAAKALGKAGIPIRRSSWPVTKSIVYSRGPGSARAVAVLVVGGVVTVVKNTDFGPADFEAQDWGRL